VSSVPRLVLDTNTLVSALLFRQGRLAWLRTAWQDGTVTPLVCTATVNELLRVLTYPKFRLNRDAITELLAEFLPYAETIALSASQTRGPRCRDPDDQVFIDLAIVANADGLVTGDRDLLALADQTSLRIQPPAEWRESLSRSLS
jgi:putative PIN family toxin of toxin-antitoxin system